MSRNAIVWGRLVFGLLSYVVVGFLFTWTPLWAEAFGMNEALSNGKALALSRASLIVLAVTLTWGFAWTKVGVMSRVESIGWVWVLTYGVGIALGLVTIVSSG
jgi:hypothetical protein